MAALPPYKKTEDIQEEKFKLFSISHAGSCGSPSNYVALKHTFLHQAVTIL